MPLMNSNPPSKAPNPYLKTKILTASPEELRLMLYEGVIRFCHQAKKAMEDKDIEAKHNSLMRAQKIVLELSTSLKPDEAPELCEKLNALYVYIYRLLVDANMEDNTSAIDEALELMEYEKQTWQMLMEKIGEGRRQLDLFSRSRQRRRCPADSDQQPVRERVKRIQINSYLRTRIPTINNPAAW